MTDLQRELKNAKRAYKRALVASKATLTIDELEKVNPWLQKTWERMDRAKRACLEFQTTTQEYAVCPRCQTAVPAGRLHQHQRGKECKDIQYQTNVGYDRLAGRP